MRKHFDEQLEEMNRELTAMGELCRRAIALGTIHYNSMRF